MLCETVLIIVIIIVDEIANFDHGDMLYKEYWNNPMRKKGQVSLFKESIKLGYIFNMLGCI